MTRRSHITATVNTPHGRRAMGVLSLPLDFGEPLPVETTDAAGRLLCRHHALPIRCHGAPCPLCWAEGRGVGLLPGMEGA